MSEYWDSRKKRQSNIPHSLYKFLPKRCEACDFDKGLHLHHKDWNHDNNSIANIQSLCGYCHYLVHYWGKPEFDRLMKIVQLSLRDKKRLRKSAEEWYFEQIQNKTRSSNPVIGYKTTVKDIKLFNKPGDIDGNQICQEVSKGGRFQIWKSEEGYWGVYEIVNNRYKTIMECKATEEDARSVFDDIAYL